MVFHSESDAFEWAISIMIFNASPKGASFSDIRGGRTHREYMMLDAMTIHASVIKYDIKDWRGSWFMEWFMPSPTRVRDWHWAEEELARLHHAVKCFRIELERIGFIPK